MRGALVTRKVLYDVLDELGQRCSGRVWLLGETSHVYEGWRSWTDAVHVWSEVRHRDEWLAALAICRRTHGVDIHDEFPGDVIPLPDGYEERAREAGRRGDLHVAHFDPYSVAFRHIARGDERSEERRVGKEWRSGWSPNPEKERSLLSGARTYA